MLRVRAAIRKTSSGVQGTPPPGEQSPVVHKTADRWYRMYMWAPTGREPGYEDYILVEYNQKNNYVSMQMMFIGVNAYMSVDHSDLVPPDGSEPMLTRVYMKYTEKSITLFYWDENEQAFDFTEGQRFVFYEEYEKRPA